MTSNPMHIADDHFCLYIFMLVELSDTLSPMHIADGVFLILFSAYHKDRLCGVVSKVVQRLQHYLVRSAALVT